MQIGLRNSRVRIPFLFCHIFKFFSKMIKIESSSLTSLLWPTLSLPVQQCKFETPPVNPSELAPRPFPAVAVERDLTKKKGS